MAMACTCMANPCPANEQPKARRVCVARVPVRRQRPRTRPVGGGGPTGRKQRRGFAKFAQRVDASRQALTMDTSAVLLRASEPSDIGVLLPALRRQLNRPAESAVLVTEVGERVCFRAQTWQPILRARVEEALDEVAGPTWRCRFALELKGTRRRRRKRRTLVPRSSSTPCNAPALVPRHVTAALERSAGRCQRPDRAESRAHAAGSPIRWRRQDVRP
jgi:hypothetical protein